MKELGDRPEIGCGNAGARSRSQIVEDLKSPVSGFGCAPLAMFSRFFFPPGCTFACWAFRTGPRIPEQLGPFGVFLEMVLVEIGARNKCHELTVHGTNHRHYKFPRHVFCSRIGFHHVLCIHGCDWVRCPFECACRRIGIWNMGLFPLHSTEYSPRLYGVCSGGK